MLVVVAICELRIKAKDTAELPTAETVFEDCDSLVEFVDFDAECIEFIFEFHYELLQHFEILLAGVLCVCISQCAGYY